MALTITAQPTHGSTLYVHGSYVSDDKHYRLAAHVWEGVSGVTVTRAAIVNDVLVTPSLDLWTFPTVKDALTAVIEWINDK